jgi:hypothetical protein
MTKIFCDICGEPACHKMKSVENETPFGLAHRQAIPEGLVQCKIKTSVVFCFVNHQSGFGGPPDLCRACAAKLISELLNKI